METLSIPIYIQIYQGCQYHTVLLFQQILVVASFLTHMHNFITFIFTYSTPVQIIISHLYYVFEFTILNIYEQRILKHDFKNTVFYNNTKNRAIHLTKHVHGLCRESYKTLF